MATYSAPQFYADDYGRTLFPLKGNTILAKKGAKRISEHLAKCIDPAEAAHSFLPQQRVYASKQNWHLRRTVKLDVVSEYYIYDLLYRNRKLFRKAHKETRSHFGYRFAGGVPISPTESYKAFKEAISKYMKQFKYFLSLDIATYFNSIYHHDLVGWLDNLGGDQKDVESFGQFLREINAGRSVDCLPQGLYPTKMIGNDFLRFVDQSHQLGCSQLIRFMDDFYLFDDSPAVLQTDFLRIQALIGGKGLSVNPKKTNRLKATHIDLESGIDAIKKKLLDRRRVVVAMDYNDDGLPPIELKAPLTLSKDEMGYITDLLNSDVIDEEDAELILTVVRKGASQVEKRLPYFISNFPNLAKNVYTFSMNVNDKEFVAKALLGALKGEAELHEYQLFWMGVMLEEYLLDTKLAADLLEALFSHSRATPVTRAKILEIPDKRYGLPELRDSHLNTGQSDWLSWAAAVGSRGMKPASRNYKLSYFSKSSPMNYLVAQIISDLP